MKNLLSNDFLSKPQWPGFQKSLTIHEPKARNTTLTPQVGASDHFTREGVADIFTSYFKVATDFRPAIQAIFFRNDCHAS